MPVFLSILKSVHLIAWLGPPAALGPKLEDKGPMLCRGGAGSPRFPPQPRETGEAGGGGMLTLGLQPSGGAHSTTHSHSPALPGRPLLINS